MSTSEQTARDAWLAAQEWERTWWGDCLHTFGEEAKQISYMQRMGVVSTQTRHGQWPVYDLAGRSILDIGGGPCSVLLKGVNHEDAQRTVVDPCRFPDWVVRRYADAGIATVRVAGEDYRTDQSYDEAWLYNVLQHTRDPEKVAANARASAKRVRVFEWLDTERNVGHPHVLRADRLEGWFGDPGSIEALSGENSLYGLCWFGCFDGLPA